MARIKEDVGGTNIERIVRFDTDTCEYQQIKVSAYCEGAATPDEVKQIAEIIEKAKDDIKKIVEEW